MRGSPLLNAIVAFLAIALLGIPIYRLTQATATAEPVVATASRASTALVQVPVELRFTSPPDSVRVRHLGKVIWSVDQPGASADTELSLPWPEEGVDLIFEIGWPENAPLSAARVVLTTPAGDELTRSVWGTGAATEVFTFR